MKRFLIILSSIFLIFFFSNHLNCEAGAASLSSIPEKSRLVLNSNGEITILLLADTQDIFPAQSDMIALQEACLDYSAPEFVIYLGDQISGPSLRSNEAKTKNAINNILLPTLERKIPFSFVFGNHDNEGGISKETQFAWY